MKNRIVLSALLVLIAVHAAASQKPQAGSRRAKAKRVVVDAVAPEALTTIGGTWVSQGAGPILGGQSENVPSDPVIGAIETIVAHPSNADVVWIGAVNGGVWKTTNATNVSPTWTAQGDTLGSMSIGALALDPTDGTSNTLVAGIGRFSSYGRVGGPRTGLYRTTNGGTAWTPLAASLAGSNFTGVAARGAIIVASADDADGIACDNIGIFRSTNSGATFSLISGANGSGLPGGAAFDLATDPTNNAVLYTAVRYAYCSPNGQNGVYKSTDTGATWTKVSNAAIDTLISDFSTDNLRIAVGASGEVYVGIIDDGILAGLFRSATGGPSWTQLDTPTTNENGSIYGLQPGDDPGSQGLIHFSIVADPTNANIVYVGGDRQPGPGDGMATFPNSIGANNYSGRLFRVNAGASQGTQATPLTHCVTATAACNGAASTSSNSAPHADSRHMVFDANGNILDGDDGGIFRRTNPRTTGDWFGVSGSLRITEMHDVAFDGVSNMIMSGNQDNGTSEQSTVGGTTWTLVESGDGGDVVVDDATSASQSTRYSSAQYLDAFYRRTVNSSGVTTGATAPALTVTGGGPPFDGQFRTPVERNAITPARLLIAGFNDLYESLDRGDTITALGFNLPATAIVYGGRSGGIDNAALIWAVRSTNVYVRTSGSGAPVLVTSPGSTSLRDIAVDTTDWQKAYVVNAAGEVWSTSNTGANWTNITGNLAQGSTDLETIAFVPGSPNAVVVGGANGVFRMSTDSVGTWQFFGTGLSNAAVWDLEYDAGDDTLTAGTMGRGAWTLNPVANLGPLPTLSIGDVTMSEGNAGLTNADFLVTLSAPSAGTVTVNYATADGTATAGDTTFTNGAAISIPSAGSSTPYPSNINVAGLVGTVSKVTVTLNSVGHTYWSDIDVLLVGPTGQAMVLMADVGGSTSVSGITLTFDDDAASQMGFGIPVSGTYKPTNLTDFFGGDSWFPPAPSGPYGSTLSVFNGLAPNGTWSLYVVDDASPDSGSIAGGWSINVSTSTGDYVKTSNTVTFNPGVTTRTISIPVRGDLTSEGNETFFVNLSGPANATLADAQGQATINNDDGPLPPANVTALATSGTSVHVSWTAAAGATSYRVYRSTDHLSYSLAGSTSGTTFDDGGRDAETAYLYKVRSYDGAEGSDSNVDLATTMVYTDPTITAQSTKVKLVHFTQLLTAVNAVRTLAGLGTIAFTAPTPATNVTVRRQHLLDLRTGLSPVWSILGLTTPTFTDTTITAGVSKIKRVHVMDVRDAVK